MPSLTHRPRTSDDSVHPAGCPLARRHLLLGAIGVATAWLAACGTTATPTPPPPTVAAQPTSAPTVAATSAPSAATKPAAATTSPATPAATPGAASTSAPTAPAKTTGAAPFPVTVTHMHGSTTIKQAPKRVLSIGYNDQDYLLALDVVPVGILRWFEEQPRAVGPWAEARLGSTQPQIFPAGDVDYELVVKLAPDLIVAVYRDVKPQEYERLSQIAPTIAAPPGFVPFGVPWREEARLIGSALGQTATMEKIITDVEGKFAAAKQQNPTFAGKTVAVSLPAAEGQFYVYAKQDSRIRFMEAIGLTLSPAIDALEKTAFYTTLSNERVDLLEADVLIFLVTSAGTLDALKNNQVLQGTTVAKQNRVIYVTDNSITQAFAMSSVLSIPYAVEKLVPEIARVLP